MHSYVASQEIIPNLQLVLILVLMEDALVLLPRHLVWDFKIVLILVLMEDALVLVCPLCYTGTLLWSLNPCFNGRCTRTTQEFEWLFTREEVLILVLMEDALVRCWLGQKIWQISVLILVLMEDALVQRYVKPQRSLYYGLNPCFNGRCTRTHTSWWYLTKRL